MKRYIADHEMCMEESPDGEYVLYADHVRELAALRESVAGVMGLIEGGYLVRNTTNDMDPRWAINQLRPIRILAEATRTLQSGKEE